MSALKANMFEVEACLLGAHMLEEGMDQSWVVPLEDGDIQ